jgi:hypothetical protein
LSNNEVKILAESTDGFTVGGYGVVFGGRDLQGDTFTKDTDLWLDKLSATPPVLFDHGSDNDLKRAVVGRVTSTRTDDIGVWVEAKLTASKRYLEAIRELVAKGVLGWSSGAVGHLVDRTKSGTLLSWAIAEFSLTPTPAEPRTLGIQMIKALAAFSPALTRAWDTDLEDARESDPPERKAMDEHTLPDSAFAFIEAGGALDEERKTVPRANRHTPHHDEQGAIDSDAVKSFLATAESADPAVAHMMGHAQELLGIKSVDTTAGVSAVLLGLAFQALRLSTETASSQAAMKRLGYQMHDGMRLDAAGRAALKALAAEVTQLVTKADEIERGVDGAAIVDMYRTAFELIDLEEVA